MNSHSPHSIKVLRFRRWSRKAWAAFFSLGKCVTIGQVCKSIAEASLLKVSSMFRLLHQATSGGTACRCQTEDIEGQEEDIGGLSPDRIYLLLPAIMHNDVCGEAGVYPIENRNISSSIASDSAGKRPSGAMLLFYIY